MLISKNRVIRRRAIIGLLFAASLTLLTLSFRDGSNGAIGAIQRSALSITAPASAVTHRVTQPFVDAWHWTTGLVDARQENTKLKAELQRATAEVLALQQQATTNAQLRQLNNFRKGTVAAAYTPVGATVIAMPNSAYHQSITLDVGSGQGIAVNDPVVAPSGQGSSAPAGLIGRVSNVTANASTVQLVTDPESAVTASDTKGGAKGIIIPSAGNPDMLQMLNVPTSAAMQQGDVIVTSGLGQGTDLKALLPPGIPIVTVTSVSESDIATQKTIQVTPFVDFQDLNLVQVLKVHH
jgi:rod shape-determining protein MreC